MELFRQNPLSSIRFVCRNPFTVAIKHNPGFYSCFPSILHQSVIQDFFKPHFPRRKWFLIFLQSSTFQTVDFKTQVLFAKSEKESLPTDL